MRSILTGIVILSCAVTAWGENWPQFRGPSFNGATTETNLPSSWTQDENIAWRIDLPGPSAATPAVWEDAVFVSSADSQKQTLKAMCFDRKSGKLRWQHDVSQGVSQDTRSNFASPSPATDGNVVVFFYGNGDLVAFNVEGQKQWSRNLGPFAFQWTFSTSPVLYDGTLYLQILQRDTPVRGRGTARNESYLLAIDPANGKTLWRHVRPSDAVEESLEAFTTPMPFTYDGRSELIVAGGDAISGHDPKTGEELWRWGTWNPEKIGHWRLVPSPVAGGDAVLACAPKRSPIYAVPAGAKGALNDDDLLWNSSDEREVSSDVPTPAFYDGDFFVLSDVHKRLLRVEPKTGKVKWSVATPGRSKYEASPLAADGKIYIVNFDGQVTVVSAADGKILNTIAMEPELESSDVVRASIVAAHGNLFIRTNTRLYCVGKN